MFEVLKCQLKGLVYKSVGQTSIFPSNKEKVLTKTFPFIYEFLFQAFLQFFHDEAKYYKFLVHFGGKNIKKQHAKFQVAVSEVNSRKLGLFTCYLIWRITTVSEVNSRSSVYSPVTLIGE